MLRTIVKLRTLAVAGILACFLLPMAGLAQETPPIPKPRPDREAIGGTGADSAAAGALVDDPTLADLPETGVPDAIVDGPPQPVSLSARITENGAIIPSGLVWRVFDTKTDSTGQLAMLGKSEAPTATFSLPPGEYVVHVAYGRSQASDTLTVELGPNTKSMIIDAGALQLNSAITGDIAIPPSLVRFDIFTSGGSVDDRALVVQNATPGDLIHLNAGTYSVASYFGEQNAVVRADLRVDPGQITNATLYHRAAQVTFKLVSEAGGEAIADVDWTVKNADGDVIFTDVGAFPSSVLAEGEYTVLAKAGDRVFNRDFAVQPSQPREVEVLTQVY